MEPSAAIARRATSRSASERARTTPSFAAAISPRSPSLTTMAPSSASAKSAAWPSYEDSSVRVHEPSAANTITCDAVST